MLNERYKRLEENISDMMAEEQAKLGYMKEAVRLYYPLSSLCNILECKTDIKGMNDVLAGFSSYMEEKYGKIMISNQINVPQAREAMDKFKMQAAQDVDGPVTY